MGVAHSRALIDLAARWELDGDCIACRACQRRQIVSRAAEAFQHRSGCEHEAAEPDPWKVLASVITAAIYATAPEPSQ